jgi:trimethylamine-N-oxide reductase (cytochrome c)
MLFSEACWELDWVKRVFDASDLPNRISWKEFAKKGYFVIAPEAEGQRTPVAYRWFANGTPKDSPEPMPLPAQFGGAFLSGLETQSGKIEFMPSSLKRLAALEGENPERPVLNRYIRQWEGPGTAGSKAYPLQMISTHSRYSFHSFNDGKDSTVNDIEDHRVTIDGHAYWVMRMNDEDAAKRGIAHHDLIRVYNERGSVICAADVSAMTTKGACKSYESAAEFDFVEHPQFGLVDRGGCVNILTPARFQVLGTSGQGVNSCLVEIEKWTDTDLFQVAAE